MELRFDAMLNSDLGNKNSDKAISNVHAGRRFPTPNLSSSWSRFALGFCPLQKKQHIACGLRIAVNELLLVSLNSFKCSSTEW